MNKVSVIESFHSFQGEGPDCGRKMYFLRVKKCNRNCQFGSGKNDGKINGCDTAVRMRISTQYDLSLKEIQKEIDRFKTNLCLTGGEPSLDIYMDQTVTMLNRLKYEIANVETNGANLEDLIKRVNKNKNVKYILSPKLFNQTDVIGYKRLVELIKNNQKVYLKIVTENKPEIIQFLDWLVEISFDMNRVYCMVEGITRDELLSNAPFVFDMAEKYKCNFSSREHIIYGFV